MRVVQMNPFSSPRQNSAKILYTPSGPSDFSQKNEFGFDFKNFKKDDWILLGLIAVLIMEGSTDYILLCALGYLFLVGL